MDEADGNGRGGASLGGGECNRGGKRGNECIYAYNYTFFEQGMNGVGVGRGRELRQ